MESSSRRILALWLPRLPTDRLKRRWKASGRPDKRPLVVAGKAGSTLRLTAVDAAGAKLGLYPGKALADARAMTPDLAVTRANETADTKLLEAVADWCERYTPLVALDPPYGLLLDVTGVAHLFGGEKVMLQKIERAVASQGFSSCMALAGTAEAARALAHYAPSAIVAPGGEAEAVALLPTEALNTEPHVIHALKRAGLKTVGQVAKRKRHELAARFGGDFVSLLDRTLGRKTGPIAPRTPLPDLTVERRFPEPVVAEAVIFETLLSLGEMLASVLESRGQGARVLEAVFFRSDGGLRRIAIETGQPTRTTKIFARLFREKLAALSDPLDPGFGFDLIRLSANLAQNLHVENTDFDANAADAEINFLIDRLTARLGSHRVMRFEPQDTHIPEAAGVAVPAQAAEGSALPWQPVRADNIPRRPFRLFAKPEPIEVLAEIPDGPPLRFRFRRVLHDVARAEGPERIAMEWWRHREQQPTRDYFRIEDGNGRRFWLYRDGIHGREMAQPRWYVHGLFA
ncbi:MAG: DNA polymerase Y family protein [Pseudomonadota bacterium]|nr:DNA polymerase Y family protein [Pseudomonadota bacterium]